MAMLAEKRSKQKWSSDPRNTAWTNDTSRFGYQMLTKMGWKSGKGLGAKEDGSTEHVKSVKRKVNLGLGADKSNEDNWLSHNLAFDDLLSKLNDTVGCSHETDSKKKKAKKHEMEKNARQSRKRVFYNRFIQSKDLSSKSAQDMACIFGYRSKSAPGTPQEQSEGEETDDSTSSCPPNVRHGVQTINSGQSIQEYFAQKMRELQAAKEGKTESSLRCLLNDNGSENGVNVEENRKDEEIQATFSEKERLSSVNVVELCSHGGEEKKSKSRKKDKTNSVNSAERRRGEGKEMQSKLRVQRKIDNANTVEKREENVSKVKSRKKGKTNGLKSAEMGQGDGKEKQTELREDRQIKEENSVEKRGQVEGYEEKQSISTKEGTKSGRKRKRSKNEKFQGTGNVELAEDVCLVKRKKKKNSKDEFKTDDDLVADEEFDVEAREVRKERKDEKKKEKKSRTDLLYCESEKDANKPREKESPLAEAVSKSESISNAGDLDKKKSKKKKAKRKSEKAVMEQEDSKQEDAFGSCIIVADVKKSDKEKERNRKMSALTSQTSKTSEATERMQAKAKKEEIATERSRSSKANLHIEAKDSRGRKEKRTFSETSKFENTGAEKKKKKG